MEKKDPTGTIVMVMIVAFALVFTTTIWYVNEEENKFTEPAKIIVCTHPLNKDYTVAYPASASSEATLTDGASREVLDVRTKQMVTLRGDDGWDCQ